MVFQAVGAMIVSATPWRVPDGPARLPAGFCCVRTKKRPRGKTPRAATGEHLKGRREQFGGVRPGDRTACHRAGRPK